LADRHSDLPVRTVNSGRGAEVAEVALQAKTKCLGFLYATGWLVLDAGVHGKQQTSGKDRLTLAQNCGK
jgi:hypothetical protein